MECHLKRVEQWFKRCVSACKCGSWSEALIEADCLEAETKGLREKLWSLITEECFETKRAGFGGAVFHTLKVAVLAFAIVLSAVIPLSVDQIAAPEVSEVPLESFALLTSVESDIINALRESLSSSNNGRVVLTVEIPEKPSAPAVREGAALASEIPVFVKQAKPEIVAGEPRSAEEDKTVEEPQQRHPSADEVISLIQVGQRVLRVPDSAIRIIR
jgi:hypothetical protein